ncbi:phage virion morphogenesis protein [Anaerosolibacter carboniphilus]|uniref:Phage virion morphogenesis protein n=1 Tax=Anaerosolibacter carboniphilus TaxID=1417629 RepID=A0A841KV54_9FIRM|nr:phage virion morphogenesis protein [Anaerosolibacter carboniphilus]MBB6214065.1 phage virion morphogenesis protein [Anaerosolibacter carboniphilus]
MNSIRLEGDVARLTKTLKNMENTDFKGINQAIAESLRTTTRERFKDQKSPSGKEWKKSIRAREQGGTTLSDSARLKNSIRSKSDESSAAVGTNTIYARTHQFGDKRTIRAKTKNGLKIRVGGKWFTKKQVTIRVPERPFLGISNEDTKEIQSILEDALRDK